LQTNTTISFSRLLEQLANPPDLTEPQGVRRPFGSGAAVFVGAAQVATPVGKRPLNYAPEELGCSAPPFALTVADIEGQLRNRLRADELRSLRRQFALLHHPDLVRGAGHDAACRDMAQVNMMIDTALALLASH
jgi:hypothetical protein